MFHNIYNSLLGRCFRCKLIKLKLAFLEHWWYCRECITEIVQKRLDEERPNMKLHNRLRAEEFAEYLIAHTRNGGSLDNFNY